MRKVSPKTIEVRATEQASIAYAFGSRILTAINHALDEEGITEDHPERKEYERKLRSTFGTRGGKTKKPKRKSGAAATTRAKLIDECITVYEENRYHTAPAHPPGFQRDLDSLLMGNAINSVMSLHRIPKSERATVFSHLKRELVLDQHRKNTADAIYLREERKAIQEEPSALPQPVSA